MAEIIPPLNRATLRHMTAGEKRVARRLESLLEEDYLVWYDIPIGKKRRYTDFIILHPSRGLLFLEAKEWKLDTLKKVSKTGVSLLTNTGEVTKHSRMNTVRSSLPSSRIAKASLFWVFSPIPMLQTHVVKSSN
jgi:hypothetical protein